MRHPACALLCALFLCVKLLPAATSDLLQVQIVHRHGARTHLSKHPTNPGEEEEAALLPQGVTELRELGNIVRQQYLLPGAPRRIRTASLNFKSPADAVSISSNLDRALASARAFLVGLYPTEHELIPTRTYAAPQNDYRLRGYAICPRHAVRISDFTRSPEFIVIENNATSFLSRLAGPVNEKASLSNVFNIYDKYALARLSPLPPGVPSPLSTPDWARLQKLADWTESQKFGPGVALEELGAPLAATLLRHSNDAISGKPTHRIIEYSAHYPTLFSLAAALTSSNAKLKAPFDAVPPFAAALLWETYSNGTLKTRWYAGDGMPPKSIALLSCDGACKIDDIAKKYGVLEEPGPFCSKCRVNAGVSSVCAPRGMCKNASAIAGVIGAVLGVFIAVAFMAITSCICTRRRRRNVAVAAEQVRRSAVLPQDDDLGWSDGRAVKFGVGLGASASSSGATSGG